MKKIMLLDTSIGTSNVGDNIIMECVDRELAYVTERNFVYRMPTHLPAFHSYAVWRKSSVVKNYTNCDYKFVGGSNLLVKDLLTHYPQWNVNIFNYQPLAGCVLVGVGAGAGDSSNSYTKRVYQKMLSHEYYHSVRDERSKEYVESLGLKALNTGCVTMWALTPEFCAKIPMHKADNVVFTLTARGEADPRDQKMIDVLQENYEHVTVWLQGDRDEAYLRKFRNTDGIEIIPPHKAAYEKVLQRENIEYVGTRLHGGIYALRHQKRATIISIDERAASISADTGLITLSKDDVDGLASLVQGEIQTSLNIPFDRIAQWKAQFEG